MGEPGLDGGGCRVSRTVLDLPDEPDDPFAQFEKVVTDSIDGLSNGSYAELFNPAQPEFRSATYAATDQHFVRMRDDGSSEIIARTSKEYVPPSMTRMGKIGHTDRYAAAKSLRSVEAIAKGRKRAQRARVSSQRLTGLAAFIAGHKRAVIGNEWRAHLSGETGAGLSADRLTREAAGFILAAIRFRVEDAADLAWRPVDAVLASRTLSNLMVLTVTLATAAIFARQGGVYGVADNLVGVGVVWGAAFGLIHYGREWRDVKPAERKPRRAKE